MAKYSRGTSILSALCMLFLMLVVFATSADDLPLPALADSSFPRNLATDTIEQQARLQSDNIEQGDFAWDVAISGDTALVGAWRASTQTGFVYAFIRTNGEWSLQQKITADDATTGSRFGQSLALEGDTALIGAPNDDGGLGALYVFTRSTGVWSQQQKLLASDVGIYHYYGSSVDIDGDTALVGALEYTNSYAGKVYVLTRDTGTGLWSEHQILTASDSSGQASFGHSVALDGSIAIIGSPGVSSNTGQAYIFTSNLGTWAEQAIISAEDAETDDWFGNSVDIDGTTVLVGAYRENAVAGSAYVFAYSSTWTQQQKLLSDVVIAGGGFGFSVALSGETAFVGEQMRGQVHKFTRNVDTWTHQQKFIPNDDSFITRFGNALALDGDDIIVGDIGAQLDGQFGAAYLFTGAPTLNVELSSATPESNEGDSDSSPADLFLIISGGVTTTLERTIDLVLTADTADSADYSQSIATITIPAGNYTTMQTLAIPADSLSIIGDAIVESDESLTLTLQNASSYVQVGDANGDSTTQNPAIYTITNDDSAVVMLDDVTESEGDTGETVYSFTATLDGVVQDGFTVNYATSDGTATSGEDYTATSGTLTFGGTTGETQTFTVNINGDVKIEATEQFSVTLDAVSVSSIDISDTAIGVIVNDDEPLEVLTDGGFEGVEKFQGTPIDWNPKDTTIPGKDKQKCNKPDKTFSYSGNCAFMFKGNPTGEKTKINQKISEASLFPDGSTLTFSVYVDKRSAKVGHPIGKLIAKYSDGNKEKVILNIPDADGYTLVSSEVTIDLTGRTLLFFKAQFRNRLTTGKFFIDDASITVTPSTALRERDLMPLPEEPDTFRD